MDVGSLFGALTGNKNVKIDIQLVPPPVLSSSLSSSSSATTTTTPTNNTGNILDHAPSWKLHKNPFWRLKHPSLLIPASVPVPIVPPSVSSNQQQQPLSIPKLNKNACYVYESSQDIVGSVTIQPPSTGAGGGSSNHMNPIEHLGISIQFIGRIDMSNSSAMSHTNHHTNHVHDFVSISKELIPPGILSFYNYTNNTMSVPFIFKNIDIDYESYTGRMVAVRYILRVKMERKFLPPVTYEKDVWFQKLSIEPTQHERIKMEVGIEDCLHIEFEYNQRHYHLHDTIRGSIRFLLVSIKLKHMELAVIRREISGENISGTEPTSNSSQQQHHVDASNVYTETQTLIKYEIMDGAPVKGEVIPVKLCLQGIPADLTPTYNAINNRFSVKYFLNLVLVDEDDRRYFKQQEIILWRKVIGQ